MIELCFLGGCEKNNGRIGCLFGEMAKIICKKTIYNKKIYFNYRLEKVKPILEHVKEEDNTNFVFLTENQNIVLSGQLEDGGENRSDD